MLDAVAAKVPRGKVRGVDGALVRALRYDCGLSLMDFGSEMGVEKVTAYRWELAEVSEVLFLGMLSKMKRKADWQPSKEILDRATAEVEALRRAAISREKKAKPPKKT